MTGKRPHLPRPTIRRSIQDPLVLETKKLLAQGMERRTLKELTRLLAHRDMRVRQEAQFALAERGAASHQNVAGVAGKNHNQLAASMRSGTGANRGVPKPECRTQTGSRAGAAFAVAR